MVRRNRTRRPAKPVATEPIPFGPPVSRREWLAVAGLVLLAAALRFAFPDRMAIEHFDEGVYASNIFFGLEEGNRYPYRHLYAPPLLPWLIEWLIVFLGPEGIAPFLPALVLGTATVPLAWWAARCWFGSASGLAAGLLVATSDFHLLYSRTALTDVPVAFFLLLAVYLYWEAVRRGSLRWSLAAGVATGLAWWTKYTGWLPLAVAASGSLAWVIFERRAGSVSPLVRAKTTAKCFAVTAITGFVVWSPVLWGLQDYGGYAAVAENHRGYLQPLSEWWENLEKHAEMLAAQSGAITVIVLSVFAAAAIALTDWNAGIGALRQRIDALRLSIAIWAAFMTGWTVFAIGPAAPLLLFTAVGLVIELFGSRRIDEETLLRRSERRLAAWLIAAWFVGMLVAIPRYQPYSRLAMPWLLAALLGATTWFAAGGALRIAAPRNLAFAIVLLVFPAAAFLLKDNRPGGHLASGSAVPGWEDRNRVRRVADAVARAIQRDRPKGEPAVVYTYDTVAGPATFFHLAANLASARTAVIPAGDLPTFDGRNPEVATYVVTNATINSPFPAGMSYSDAESLRALPVGWLDAQSTPASLLTRLDHGGRGYLAVPTPYRVEP